MTLLEDTQLHADDEFTALRSGGLPCTALLADRFQIGRREQSPIRNEDETAHLELLAHPIHNVAQGVALDGIARIDFKAQGDPCRIDQKP